MSERYRRTALLAQGGMAELYAGVAYGEEGFRRPVAIKRVLPQLQSYETVAKHFIDEARLAMRLQHQNLVQVLDVGRAPDGLFLVMELIDGWDVDQVLRCAQRVLFPAALGVLVGQQVLAGLSFAYRQQSKEGRRIAAHRDISASNVLVSVEGEVKVGDFGIARLTAGDQASDPGVFKGKYAYAAPEVLNGRPATAASDQFSLGVLLHRMLGGAFPFGNADEIGSYVKRLAENTPTLILGLSTALQDVLNRMLAKAPENRFPTPEACAQALSAALRQSGEAPTALDLAEFLRSLPLGPSTMVRSQIDMAADTQSSPTEGQWIELSSSFEGAGISLDTEGRLSPMTPARSAEPSISILTPSNPGLELARPPTRGAMPPRATPSPFVPPPFVPPQEEPLELSVITRRKYAEPVETFREVPPPPKSHTGLWVVALVLFLGALGGLGYVALQSPSLLPPALRGQLPRKPPAQLVVDTEPPDAEVKILGQSVGTTPLALENLYPTGPVAIEVTHRGYRPWKGTFKGSEPGVLRIDLKKK